MTEPGTNPRSKLRIGIVGSDIAGSSAAYFARYALGPDIDIVVFEREAQVGGRVLLGETIWQQAPTEAARDALSGDEPPTMAHLVDVALEQGFRPLSISEASREEWDDFESRYGLRWERWLLDHQDDPDVARVRAQADEHRHR